MLDPYAFAWLLIALVLVVCAILAWQDRNDPLGTLRRIRSQITIMAITLDGIEAELNLPGLPESDRRKYEAMHADAMETLRRLTILERTMEQYVGET